ncbi:epidermal differentiation-specific protein-like [Garra rufa]|uniref:epidermal differentiation-specific protein-like n=1 Tax=Garra rufa TaxID=137080 RepID=UPI003CCEA63F
MNKIIIFSEEAFRGRTAEFKNDVHNLEENAFNKGRRTRFRACYSPGFNDVISSVKVVGAPWVAYYGKNFTGKQRLFEEGEYATLEDKGRFSSLRMITDDLENPKITLFEHVNYQGRKVILHEETNLHNIDFSNVASSHKVKGGVWVLYEHINRQGAQLVCFPGEKVPSYIPLSFNDVVSYVRPLLPKP